MGIFEAVKSGTKEDVAKEFVGKLGKLGTSPTDDEGRTLLHYAARRGDLKIFEIILNSEAKHINVEDPTGRTALHFACAMNRSPEIAESLLKNGADATIKDENNATALDYFLRNEKFQPDDKKK